jgi:acyl carrier protein
VHSNVNLKVREIIAGHFGVEAHHVTDEARFRDDFGADWLDRLELIIAMEDQVPSFELVDVVADHIDTVGVLCVLSKTGRTKAFAKSGNQTRLSEGSKKIPARTSRSGTASLCRTATR